MTRDEGVIKFKCLWQEAALESLDLSELIAYRGKLFALNLIGVYDDGIGFGNISQRLQNGSGAEDRRFAVSASQTGHLETVSPADFAVVTAYSVTENWVRCIGSKKASSESLTHAMIYELLPDARAVIHVHHNAAWSRLLESGTVPTTRASVPYGTPAMAAEMARLLEETDVSEGRILAMAGHEDGILAFGDSLQSAFNAITDSLRPELQNS